MRNSLAARMQHLGGNSLNRIKLQKQKSLRQVFNNNANTRYIKVPNKSIFPCLITSDQTGLKSDYDKETITVEFTSGLSAGKTFEALDDGTKWMVYLPHLAETAYLVAQIIRCRYELEINGIKYPIYFQGPTETKIQSYGSGNNIRLNSLNYSGTIYITKDENTTSYFNRFSKLLIDGHRWTVEVFDEVSVPGVIELEVQEDSDSITQDVPRVERATKSESIFTTDDILGDTIVQQNSEVGYLAPAAIQNKLAEWIVSGNHRVKIKNISDDNTMCKVFIPAGTVGDFTISYGDYSKNVKIDWEWKQLEGNTIVYPYDVAEYHLPIFYDENDLTTEINRVAEFSIDNDLAEIIDFGDDWCTVKVKTGRKGKFTVKAILNGTLEELTLPVEIKSL